MIVGIGNAIDVMHKACDVYITLDGAVKRLSTQEARDLARLLEWAASQAEIENAGKTFEP